MYNMINLEADGQQQQKTTLGFTPISQEQESEATVGHQIWAVEDWKKTRRVFSSLYLSSFGECKMIIL